jgi:ABC-type multidrug transport system fused ATPase/permease subunit
VCRLGSARLADRILVLAGGRIAEKGTHAELMQRGGLCQQLTG